MKTLAIEMLGSLPRYVEDDMQFVVQTLPQIEPCSIAPGGLAGLMIPRRPLLDFQGLKNERLG
jgi:hypothetical protein